MTTRLDRYGMPSYEDPEGMELPPEFRHVRQPVMRVRRSPPTRDVWDMGHREIYGNPWDVYEPNESPYFSNINPFTYWVPPSGEAPPGRRLFGHGVPAALPVPPSGEAPPVFGMLTSLPAAAAMARESHASGAHPRREDPYSLVYGEPLRRVLTGQVPRLDVEGHPAFEEEHVSPRRGASPLPPTVLRTSGEAAPGRRLFGPGEAPPGRRLFGHGVPAALPVPPSGEAPPGRRLFGPGEAPPGRRLFGHGVPAALPVPPSGEAPPGRRLFGPGEAPPGRRLFGHGVPAALPAGATGSSAAPAAEMGERGIHQALDPLLDLELIRQIELIGGAEGIRRHEQELRVHGMTDEQFQEMLRVANALEPRRRARGGSINMKKQAKRLQSLGRHGDTILAHINPIEAMMLKRMGGSGTINPHTKLPEFGFMDSLIDFSKGLTHFLGPVGDAIGNGLPHLFGEAGIDEMGSSPEAPRALPPVPMTLNDWYNKVPSPTLDDWKNVPHGSSVQPFQQNTQYPEQNQSMDPYGYKRGGMTHHETSLGHTLSRLGRYGDTMIAHIHPHQARMLQRAGGSGTINPRTGLREYGPLLGFLAPLVGSIAGAGVAANIGLGVMGGLASTAIGGALGGALGAGITGGNIGRGALMGGLGGLGYGMMGPVMNMAGEFGMPNLQNLLNAPITGAGAKGLGGALGGIFKSNPMLAPALMMAMDRPRREPSIGEVMAQMQPPQSMRREFPRIRWDQVDEPRRYQMEEPRRYRTGGFITGHTGGQADEVLDAIPENSYVISADVVADLGDGNSLAGAKKLAERFEVSRIPPRSMKHVNHFARGASVSARVSDGEYIVPVHAVVSLGKGNPSIGSKKLDNLMKNVRHHKATKNFPPKAKSIDSYLSLKKVKS